MSLIGSQTSPKGTLAAGTSIAPLIWISSGYAEVEIWFIDYVYWGFRYHEELYLIRQVASRVRYTNFGTSLVQLESNILFRWTFLARGHQGLWQKKVPN